MVEWHADPNIIGQLVYSIGQMNSQEHHHTRHPLQHVYISPDIEYSKGPRK